MKTPVPYYRVRYRVVPAEAAQTVSETLIKPCAVEMVPGVFGERSTEKPETVHLSNNTIKRLIRDIMLR
jgi:hypothetical protein